MIGIDIGKLVANFGNNHMAPAMLGLHLSSHVRLPAFGTHQVFDRHTLHGVRLARTVGFIRRYGNTEGVASLAAFQSFYQTPDNAAMAMQVRVRLAVPGGFNNVALLITDVVVKQDHLILFYGHNEISDRFQRRPLYPSQASFAFRYCPR